MDKLLTVNNIKRAGKAVKYGAAFANAYKEMSQVLPINNLLPDFMTNNVFSQSMGATLKTINAMSSANDKRNYLLKGIKQNLERGDVSQFEMLMQAMQTYAQRENDKAVNELMQRMYGDINGGGGYGASAFGVNDSLRSMVDSCSISPQSERTQQPHAMIPHHRHTGISHDPSMQTFSSGTRAHEVYHSHDNCLPPSPDHSMSAGFHSSPHTMQHCHTGPPVSHMHSSYTASGTPANDYNVPRGPMVPCDNFSTPARPVNNGLPQHTVPPSNFSVSSMPVLCDNYNTSAGPTSQPTASCNNHNASTTPLTSCNAPVTGCTVTPNHTNYSAPAHPGFPLSQTNYTSVPVAPSAPYRNDVNLTISAVSYSNQAYPTTPQSGYRPPVTPHQNYINHAMPVPTAPYGNRSIHATPRVPYNHGTAYSAPLNNSRANYTTYGAHQSNYSVSRPPQGNYSVPAVSTIPGSTVITIPQAGPHSNYTVLKIPTASASTAQPQSHAYAFSYRPNL